MRCLRRLEYRSLCSNGYVCNYLAVLYPLTVLYPFSTARLTRLTGTRTVTHTSNPHARRRHPPLRIPHSTPGGAPLLSGSLLK